MKACLIQSSSQICKNDLQSHIEYGFSITSPILVPETQPSLIFFQTPYFSLDTTVFVLTSISTLKLFFAHLPPVRSLSHITFLVILSQITLSVIACTHTHACTRAHTHTHTHTHTQMEFVIVLCFCL